MTVECRQGDTGARGHDGDETIGKSGSQPLAAEVEDESPGFGPQFRSLGDERVVFFDFGRIRTACGVALEMIRGIVGRIAKP